MWPVPQQPPVLDRSRFALFAVGHNDGATGGAPVVASRAPYREREAGPASAEEPAGLRPRRPVSSAPATAGNREFAGMRKVFAAPATVIAQQPWREAGQELMVDDWRGAGLISWLRLQS